MEPAVKLDIIIPEDHRLQVDLPEELPSGPAEIIVRPIRQPPAPEPPSQSPAPQNLADLFAAHIGVVDSRIDEPLSEEGGNKLADALEIKRKAGHL